jgi:hypothetical protein
MHTTQPPDEVTTKEALAILGLSNPSTISRYVDAGALTPSRKLPGRTGPFLFLRHDIEALAEQRRALAS